MRTLIDVPFRDAAAAELGWSLRPGGPAPEALATLDVPASPCALRLAVLGASHAVGIALPDGTTVTETVACGLTAGRPLAVAPDRVDDHGVRYRFSAHVDVPGTDAVVALSDELHDLLAADPHGLVAAFPGVPGATTGLRAVVRQDGVSWDTWHLYPERGEVVRTRSSAAALLLAGAAR
ncbi:DUF2617 family protein [Patulibacter minatonensis]|uniref:DUF2617 family protein n=1 Tax=Patulibacter minatonensis TaxID=298163 RepID=UPI00047ED603|nr:DUF2617 family protein [Patulibacter minatonensis]